MKVTINSFKLFFLIFIVILSSCTDEKNESIKFVNNFVDPLTGLTIKQIWQEGFI